MSSNKIIKMTNEKKLEVIEEAFNYYHDRTSLNNKEEKELLLLVNEIYAAIDYTQCCETLKDKYEIVFEDWLKDHKFNQDNNGFYKEGIRYKVNEITWMYIQDVYNL